MPLFDYLCLDCGKQSEILVASSGEAPRCEGCGSGNLRKMLSAPSTLSGAPKDRLPGTGDTGCCGTSPVHAGCAGPGSCCGKA
ncbi:MAG: zinc ribbon domain-containing protein [Deltaproteobacteria bacterium]|nr:zinc ribbon domain-containing protein [Deltaproteobacteria bacterium]